MAASISIAAPTSLPAATSPRKRKPSRKKKRRRRRSPRQSPLSNPTTRNPKRRNPRRKNRKRSLRWQRPHAVLMRYPKLHAPVPGVRDEHIRDELASFVFRVWNFCTGGRSCGNGNPIGEGRARHV